MKNSSALTCEELDALKSRVDDTGLTEYWKWILANALPSLRVVPDNSGQSRSHFGGVPHGGDIAWPVRGITPLAFLFHLDFAEVSTACKTLGFDEELLPDHGDCELFFDLAECPSGNSRKEAGGAQVLFHEMHHSTPLRPPREGAPPALPERPVRYVREVTIPPPMAFEEESGGADVQAYADLVMRLGETWDPSIPVHRILGHQQSWGTAAFTHAARMFPEVDDWLLLLQLDTDGDSGLSLGEARIQFVMSRQALRRRDASRLWYHFDLTSWS